MEADESFHGGSRWRYMEASMKVDAGCRWKWTEASMEVMYCAREDAVGSQPPRR